MISDTHQHTRQYFLARFWDAALGFWRGRGRRTAWVLTSIVIAIALVNLTLQYRLASRNVRRHRQAQCHQCAESNRNSYALDRRCSRRGSSGHSRNHLLGTYFRHRFHRGFSGSSAAIPGFLVVAALVYAALASGSMIMIASGFVKASEHKNQAEAEYRYVLTRVAHQYRQRLCLDGLLVQRPHHASGERSAKGF